MSKNGNLNKAYKNKNDEFYTQLSDVEQELKHYVNHFKNKVVYCNCDTRSSNFFKYFQSNFKSLGIKKLITSCYQKGSENAVYSEYTGDNGEIAFEDLKGDGDSKTTFALQGDGDSKTTFALQGDGDFRNQENIDLLKTADIIVTNPPFSLFREYVAQLLKYDKQFLIVGSLNAITYKEIFSFIKENKIWQGHNGGSKWFEVPNDYEIKNKSARKIVDGRKYFKMGNVIWFTNLETSKRKEDLTLYKKYTPANYPKFDNYNAINVNKVKDIPCDYTGIMGVPITFIDKYNPEQFEIIGITTNYESILKTRKYFSTDDPNFQNLNKCAILKIENGYKAVYCRVLIKRKYQCDAGQKQALLN